MATTVWRGYITFGLISIPVRLFRAARAERVNLRRVALRDASLSEEAAPRQEPTLEPEGFVPDTTPAPEPAFEPVQQREVQRSTGEALPPAQVWKGYEYEQSKYVTVTKEELKSLAAATSAQMEILEFVHLAEIDPVYFETSYYVRPEEAGQAAYALLYRALQKTALVAIGQFSMHGREHVFVVRPGQRGMLAHTLFYTSEVRAADEYYADVSAIKQRELDLSEQLIHSLAASFEPSKYKDLYRERLEALLAAKVEGRSAAQPAAPAAPKPVVDIADALRRSLAQLKKPPAAAAKAAGASSPQSKGRPRRRASAS